MVKDANEKIDHYYSLNPDRYTVVKSITLAQSLDDAGEMRQSLSIRLTVDDGFMGNVLNLDLFGVRNLRINQPELSLISFSILEIVGNSYDTGFDRRFVVLDAEEGVLSCSCDDFFVSIESQ